MLKRLSVLNVYGGLVMLCMSWSAQADTAQAAIQHSIYKVGSVLSYKVSGYHMQTELLSDKQVRWTYLDAPTAEEKGKTALEDIDQIALRDDLLLMAWTEKSGANVVDVFDFKNQTLYANFVMPDGKRYQSQTAFEIQAPKTQP